jgi:prepilin-type N-terminal cleavage/methylation domain-containing protein
MSSAHRKSVHRGFTLIEAVVAIVVLAIAVPAGLALMRDAAIARMTSAKTARAFWLANAIAEQMMADIDSNDAGLGFEAMANPTSYVEDAPDALRTRLAPVVTDAVAEGFFWSITAGALVDATGASTGDPTHDLYRNVTVQVAWFDPQGQPRLIQLPFVAAERRP